MAWRGPVDPELPPASVTPPRAGTAAGVVAFGGAAGAVIRAALTGIDPSRGDMWPWATLLVNLSGSLAIGVLMVVLLERYPSSTLPRLFLGTGFLGGYTTFSAVSHDAVALGISRSSALAAAYVTATVLGAVLACLVGVAAAQAAMRRARVADVPS